MPIAGHQRTQSWPVKPERASHRRQRIRHGFLAKSSEKHLERLREAKEEVVGYGQSLQVVFLGIAAKVKSNGQSDIGFAAHDGTYSIDFAIDALGGSGRDESPNRGGAEDGRISGTATPVFNPEDIAAELSSYITKRVSEYEEEHMYKIAGVGLAKHLVDLSPQLPARLWGELDIVPMVFEMGLESVSLLTPKPGTLVSVDEEADAMARKCLMYFGPNMQPRVQVGYRNEVEVDASGHVRLTVLDQYRQSVGDTTWKAVTHYATSIKERNIKIAFFNSTPQGGGVALMRHALVRFFRNIGVQCSWYVPRPKPEVFRITKTNHNILQGVAASEERLSGRQIRILDEWTLQNAQRFWVLPGGPLAPRSKGGADVIIVDDPQMPQLVKLSKEVDPERPVIFRSHIQVRSDLADQEGTPTSEVWKWIWDSVQRADVFISHPVREFVPKGVDFDTVGYMPATTDWLDGLNKDIGEYDTQYYMHEFNAECFKEQMTRLNFPKRDYIVQIARFDPAKGIPDLLASYAEFRHKYLSGVPKEETPQLVIAGHGAVDDPDGSRILDETLEACETKYADLKDDIVVLRLGPTDQLLNTLMSNAKVALQLSTREGFEVKVSEALHKGVPIIATKAGGIPLQVQHGKSGFLVEPGNSSEVAMYLNQLFTDQEAYERMSEFAAMHVSDEVSTVGNALCWMYLADALSKGEKVLPNSKWINDMAREAAGVPYKEGETRLPRKENLDLRKEVE